MFSGDAEFFAKFYYDINNFNLEQIDFRNNELNYNGSTKIKRDEKEVNYQLDFNFNTMKIEDFLSFMDFTSLYNSKDIKQRSTSGSLKLEIEKFFSKNIRLDTVKIHSILNPKNIEIKNFKADFYGGSISFSSSIEFADTIMTNSQVKLCRFVLICTLSPQPRAQSANKNSALLFKMPPGGPQQPEKLVNKTKNLTPRRD